MIRSIDKKYLERKFSRPRLRDPEIIAIDEIDVGKTNRFFTIVIDRIRGAIVYVGDGKGEMALNRFWKRLRGSKAKIRAVATDMASAYNTATRKNVPEAKHVFDRFHIVKLMNEKLTRLRRELQNEADKTGKKVLKGLRWLLWKFNGGLNESKNEPARLMDAPGLNQSLAIADYLKEDLARIWQQRDKATADRFLTDWCARARASEIQVLQAMASAFRQRHTLTSAAGSAGRSTVFSDRRGGKTHLQCL